ncbi:uncharacterized protein [Aegilops tauschii subsp. strangulata]|uniref:uncharacterized protein isoform X2 n=1 Tax=Aegilops tauschii subsp. strangulata TaxID=200361 RepID=UPI003CC886E5
MSLCPMSPSVRPVIAEMEMNAGTDQDATTVRATVVQACGMFHDTPATFEHTAVCPGGSSIISPSGAVLAGPNYEGKALLAADLGEKKLMAGFQSMLNVYCFGHW